VKALRILLFSLLVCGFVSSVASAEGDAEKGQALFNKKSLLLEFV